MHLIHCMGMIPLLVKCSLLRMVLNPSLTSQLTCVAKFEEPIATLDTAEGKHSYVSYVLVVRRKNI